MTASSSRPRAPRPCSATPPWPSTPTTSGTRTWSAPTVELPLTGRMIPIVADAHVDPSFGTGAVKVTPAHDPNDFEIGRRHDLPVLAVMDEHGVITAHGPFQGLDRFEARPAVVAALREDGRIVKEVRPYVHAVGHCSRCSSTVEPRLSLQWFVLRRAARRGGWRRRSRRPGEDLRAAGDERQVLRLGGRHARLVHLPPAVVGAQDPGLVRARRRGALRRPGRDRRRRAGRRTLTSSTPGSPPRCGRSPPSAGRTTPRTCAPSTRRACSSRRTTSCSSGSPG